MADLLSAVKSVRHQTKQDAHETTIKAVNSTSTRSKALQDEHRPVLSRDAPPDDDLGPGIARTAASTPEEALKVLRQEPDLPSLLGVLSQLRRNAFPSGAFSLHSPGPLQAQIINFLLVRILPNFWVVLSRSQQDDLTACLRNVAGLNAAIAQLKQFMTEQRSSDTHESELVAILLEVIQRLFVGDDMLSTLWREVTTNVADSNKRDMMWKESVHLVGSGKIVATIAQAEDLLQRKSHCWLSNGNQYAAWLGRNIASVAMINFQSLGAMAGAQVLTRALNLGYPNMVLIGLFENVSAHNDATTIIESLSPHLPAHSKRTLTEHTLRWLSSLGADSYDFGEDAGAVAATSSFLWIWIQDDSNKQHVMSYLTNPALLASVSLSVIRACIVVLSKADDTDDLYRTLEKQMSTFSDRIFIDHAPIAQQENLVRALLIISGYLHRLKPIAFLVLGRSAIALHGVSNRLDSSNSRARWLGMVVATAISRLVDKGKARLSFETDELETEDGTWYLSLTSTEDRIGAINDLTEFLTSHVSQNSSKKPVQRLPQRQKRVEINGKPVFGPPRPPAQTEIVGERVTEVLDDDFDGGSDDDPRPYAKPDSDPEDSDEDATMVNRKKVGAPVYIRDLMSMLRDDQSHDRFQMGMKHAASLIRRKRNFGVEVKDHAEELARILCNLQDPFETEGFDELKLQALIAVLLADVESLAPWLSRQAFSGDYSIAQRCIILSALGLGGRELAGFSNDDNLNPVLANTSFPSKHLPPHLHSVYSTDTSITKRLDAASTDMERALIQPIALQAADQTTSHLDAVKVRKFSSRMEVERTKRKPAANQLAKIFGEKFFFPLANGYQQEIAAYSTASVYASTPFVLVTFLKTVALLLHASGPATIDLPRICSEFWDLLLSLRVQAISDVSILQAVLFSLLTLLEVIPDKRQIAEEFPRPLMETQQWVDLVFERTGGGHLISDKPDDDEAKVRTLAAGVLVKTKEIIDAYQKQLVGYSS